MKRTKLASLFMAMVLVLSSVCVFSVSAAAPSYTAKLAATAPTIDGTIDAVWDTAAWSTLDICKGPESAFKPKFKMLHDSDNVYILGVAAAEGFSTSNAGVEGFYISFSGGTPCETCDTTTVGGKTVCKNHKEIRFFANGSSYQTYNASKDGDGWIGSPESYIVGYAVDTEATVDNAAAYVYEIAIAKTALDGGIGANMAFEIVYINASADTD